MCSIIIWFKKSNSSISQNCSGSQICATKGPSLSIASNFLIFPAIIIFLIIYYKRKSPTDDFSLGNSSISMVKTLDITQMRRMNTPDDTQLIKKIDE